MIGKKVVVINSDRRTISARVLNISEILSENGYLVRILTWDRQNNFETEEIVSGIQVHNYKFNLQSDNTIRMLFAYLHWWIFVVYYLVKSDSHIYHPLSIYNVIPCILAKTVKRSKLIYDITDFAADSLNCPKLVQSLLALFENACLYFADAVIIVDEHRRSQINMKRVKKMAVVMNTPSDIFGAYVPKIGSNIITIYYGGWLNETRGILDICRAINGLNNVNLIVAGFGPEEGTIKKLAMETTNIEYLGLLSKEESLKRVSSATAICAFYDPKLKINRLASPNKLFDAMMCSTAVIANREALPVAEIIEESKCGMLVTYGNINEIIDAIESLRDTDLVNRMGLNGRKAFDANYSRDIMAERLIELYSSVDC
jgi:glycosyltransferase involved in cell wall biosynthesis